MTTNKVTTERLTIRQLTHDDAPFILQLVNEPGWLEHIGERNVHNIDQAKGYIGIIQNMYHKHDCGLLLVSKHDATPIGLCGLLIRDDPVFANLDDADVGYALLAEYCGQGYAFEAVQGILHYAKNTQQRQRVLAITTDANTSSVKLLKKTGFSFERYLKLQDETTLGVYYKQL